MHHKYLVFFPPPVVVSANKVYRFRNSMCTVRRGNIEENQSELMCIQIDKLYF